MKNEQFLEFRAPLDRCSELNILKLNELTLYLLCSEPGNNLRTYSSQVLTPNDYPSVRGNIVQWPFPYPSGHKYYHRPCVSLTHISQVLPPNDLIPYPASHRYYHLILLPLPPRSQVLPPGDLIHYPLRSQVSPPGDLIHYPLRSLVLPPSVHKPI